MADNMDVDMDVDIDLGADEDIARFEEQATSTVETPHVTAIDSPATNGIPAAYDDDIDKSLPAPTKLHIRGLDHLTTADIQHYLQEHFQSDDFKRVEWIDDASANLLFATPGAANEALENISDLRDSAPDNLSPLELRRAKTSSAHPAADFQIRQATLGDVKAPRARDKSRFYLMNPEHDRAERRRRPDDRSRRGGHGRRSSNEGRKRDEAKTFDESMYDDGAPAPAQRQPPRRESLSSSDAGRQRRLVRFKDDDDLLAGKTKGRLRDRSASPIRDGDGRYGFDDDQPRRRTARQRDYTPPPRHRDLRDNSVKELFPTAPPASTLPPAQASRELFPTRTASSTHRHIDGLDGDESRDLASRISGGSVPRAPAAAAARAAEAGGFSIKGAGDAPGFSIRGASRDVVNPRVKELFPMKAGGNQGKELFADGAKSRGGPRRRAEDLF